MRCVILGVYDSRRQVRGIVAQGMDVNMVGDNGITAAHIAAFMGHVEVRLFNIRSEAHNQTMQLITLVDVVQVLSYLCQAGADVNPSSGGDSPLDTALRKAAKPVLVDLHIVQNGHLSLVGQRFLIVLSCWCEMKCCTSEARVMCRRLVKSSATMHVQLCW